MQVDVSWNPAWVGTEQVRFFKFDGERLLVISAWTPSTTCPEILWHRLFSTHK
jgi:hypothetical protein